MFERSNSIASMNLWNLSPLRRRVKLDRVTRWTWSKSSSYKIPIRTNNRITFRLSRRQLCRSSITSNAATTKPNLRSSFNLINLKNSLYPSPTLTLIGRTPPRILRYQARLCASPLLQPAQAPPRRPVDRVLGIDAATRAPRRLLLLLGPDRSSVRRRLVHADAPPRRSLVRDNRAPRALVQALRRYGPSRAPLGASIDQLHVRHAPPRAPRRVRYQRVAGASPRSQVPVLGNEGRPRPGQRDQAVPRAPVVPAIRHQRVSRAERRRVGEQRVARAVEQVGIRVRDQTVARASRHATVAAGSIVIVRDQRVSRASRNHLLVERRLAPRVAVLVRKRLVVDHGLKRMWANFGETGNVCRW